MFLCSGVRLVTGFASRIWCFFVFALGDCFVHLRSCSLFLADSFLVRCRYFYVAVGSGYV